MSDKKRPTVDAFKAIKLKISEQLAFASFFIGYKNDSICHFSVAVCHLLATFNRSAHWKIGGTISRPSSPTDFWQYFQLSDKRSSRFVCTPRLFFFQISIAHKMEKHSIETQNEINSLKFQRCVDVTWLHSQNMVKYFV